MSKRFMAKFSSRFLGRNKEKGKTNTFEDSYILEEKLGSGQFATVYKGVSKEDNGKIFAIKVIDKSKLTDKLDKEGLEMEIDILTKIDHAGIIKLYDVFETSTKWMLVTELAPGGELFDRIVTKTANGRYSEQEAALIVMQIAESLKYCHDHHIVHRDLKPENLLLDSEKDDAKVKLADFGFAAHCEKPLKDGCGTLVYVAPEILRGDAYQTAPDMWSLGVITYILLCGYPPFFHTDQDELGKRIVRGRYKFRAEDWDHVSNNAKEFIRGLLKREPSNRMTADDVLQHPWITEYSKLSNTGLNIQENLKKFQTDMLLKRALFALRAIGGMNEMLKDFDADAVVEGEEDLAEGGK